MKKRTYFIIAVAIPLLILLAMTVKPLLTMTYGQEILLETKAVEPTDLFRGDYVEVSFKISDIPLANVNLPAEKFLDKQLYVSLKPKGQYYEVENVMLEKPKEGIYLKARMQYYDNIALHLDYSLDKYFVKQGTGLELERASAKGALVGQVKVYDGYGILVGIKPKN